MLQRAHEKRRALFSCFYWAVYSWNLEAMQSAGSPPGQATWKAMLVSAARCRGGGPWPEAYAIQRNAVDLRMRST